MKNDLLEILKNWHFNFHFHRMYSNSETNKTNVSTLTTTLRLCQVNKTDIFVTLRHKSFFLLQIKLSNVQIFNEYLKLITIIITGK